MKTNSRYRNFSMTANLVITRNEMKTTGDKSESESETAFKRFEKAMF